MYLGPAARMSNVILEEFAILRMHGSGGLHGRENSLLDLGIGVGEGKNFAAAAHRSHHPAAAAPSRTAAGRRRDRQVVVSSLHLKSSIFF